MPYRNELERGDFEQRLIWVRQMRVHYLFATKK
jgi:hypothetical protein